MKAFSLKLGIVVAGFTLAAAPAFGAVAAVRGRLAGRRGGPLDRRRRSRQRRRVDRGSGGSVAVVAVASPARVAASAAVR